MKKVVVYILSLVFFIACLNMKQESFDKAALLSLENNIDTIIALLKSSDRLVEKDKLQELFSSSRKNYKKVEPFVEYYFQGLTRRINGPALPEIKTDDNMINDPSGFQVIEEIIYSDTVDLLDLKKQTKILTTDLLFIKNTMKEMPIQEHHFYELIQHQIIRIAALGITGFDSPIAFESIEEAAFTLDGINEWYLLYCNIKGKKVNQQLTSLFKNAIVYAQKNNNFNEFNRLEFIKNHLMPISV